MIFRRQDEQTLRLWAGFLSQIRGIFNDKGFLEVTTPHLVDAGAFEAVIDPLQVCWSTGRAELHTSPEIEMKQALANANAPIYQVCASFRDDPDTGMHGIEFSMLEFYRPSATYHETRQDMRELFEGVSKGQFQVTEISVAALVEKVTGVRIHPAMTFDELASALNRLGIHVASTDSWSDLFFRLMIERVEPQIPADKPVLIFDYPPAIAALSAVNSESGWVEKFEIYWKGMELCNGCTELPDVVELKHRYEEESRQRLAAGKKPHPYPSRLEAAMLRMPRPSSGVAVGLDRLFACLYPANLDPARSLREYKS